MRVEHTPGPWNVWYCSPTHVVIQSPDRRTVARLIHKNFDPSPLDLAETAANAALIKAAPSLLRVLCEAVTAHAGDGSIPWLPRAHAAIVEATPEV
jgi:hypothetical protein